MELIEIIKDSKFNEFLYGEIHAYNGGHYRPEPDYKRPPLDRSKYNGKSGVECTLAEFDRIVMRESRLSSGTRSAITLMVLRAARQTLKFRADEEKKAREEREAKESPLV
jgi:hypothetical protein